jgi:hypothetical protein
MEGIVMPSGPASAKSKARYGNIKESIKKQGKSDALAEQIAAQTVDRRRAPRSEGDAPRDGVGLADAPGARRVADTARRRKR